jgi:hypothetical protein
VRQVELDLFDEAAVVVDVLVHRGIRRFLELVQLLFKHAEFRIALCTVLGDELLPRIRLCFASHDSGVRRTIGFDGIKKVIEREAVFLIPFVDVDLVR